MGILRTARHVKYGYQFDFVMDVEDNTIIPDADTIRFIIGQLSNTLRTWILR